MGRVGTFEKLYLLKGYLPETENGSFVKFPTGHTKK